MKIPFLTRLMEIKEDQLINENMIRKYNAIQCDTLERIESILIKLKRGCKNGK
jgi:hypothetical protein